MTDIPFHAERYHAAWWRLKHDPAALTAEDFTHLAGFPGLVEEGRAAQARALRAKAAPVTRRTTPELKAVAIEFDAQVTALNARIKLLEELLVARAAVSAPVPSAARTVEQQMVQFERRLDENLATVWRDLSARWTDRPDDAYDQLYAFHHGERPAWRAQYRAQLEALHVRDVPLEVWEPTSTARH